MNNQLPALTGLRGIAALFILIHHTVVYFLPEIGQYAIRFTPFFKKGYLWVDFFFILSGFIMVHVYRESFYMSSELRKYKRFMVARFARIYPLHLLMIVCFLMVELFQIYLHSGQAFSGKQSVLSLTANVTLFQAFLSDSFWNEPAWAISAEWLIYFLVPLLIIFSKKSNRFVDIMALFLAFSVLFMLVFKRGTLDFVSWKSIVRCGVEMIIGIFAYKYKDKIQNFCLLNNSHSGSGLMLCVFITLYLPVNHLITICFFPLLIISAAHITNHFMYTNPIAIFLGKISYSIYMIHWFFMDFLNNVSKVYYGYPLHSNFSLPGLIYIACAFLIGMIPIATMTYMYFEEPMRSFIKNKL